MRIQLPLTERSHGLYVATVTDVIMVREFGFVLAVRANVPAKRCITHFPAQMKVAPVTKIRDLVQLQLPGMMLRAMPTAPRRSHGTPVINYFQLEKGGELWKRWKSPEHLPCISPEIFPGWTCNFGHPQSTCASE